MNLIILAGMPATGKSTVASALSKVFGYPILEKDNIKEGLFDTLGFSNYPQKRKLDIAANAVLLRVLESMLKANTSVIVDNNFDTESAAQLRTLIDRYAPQCLTIFLYGNENVLYQRYAERDHLHLRHLGHILQEHYPPIKGECTDYTMTPDEFHEKFFNRGMSVFQCPGKRIDLDVTDYTKVDMESLIKQARNIMIP